MLRVGIQLEQVQNMIWQMFVMILSGYTLSLAFAIEQMTIHNRHLKVGIVPRAPIIAVSKDNNGQDVFGGMLGKMIDYFKIARNCTFQVMIPDDGLWGNCNEENCTGMIGLVNRSEVDFAFGMMKDVFISI